jgi:hypothetical protein
MIEMNCKGCVFAQKNNDKQYGCSLERVDKLGTTREDDSGMLVLNRFCNTYRPQQWIEKLSLDEQLNKENIVLKEVEPRVGFLVYFDLEKENPSSWLESTLMDIRDQVDIKARYIIVANKKVEYNEEIFNILNKFFPSGVKHHIVQLTSDFENENIIIDECSRHFLNGWLYVTKSGFNVDRQLIKTLHNKINFEMKTISVVLPPHDGINELLFQTSLFKYLNGNLKRRIDEEHFDNRPFLEKVKDLDNGNCIFTWSDIYEA